MKYNVNRDLKLISEYLNISQNEVASFIGISPEALSRSLSSNEELTKELLEKIYSFIYDKCPDFNQKIVNLYSKNHDVILFHGSKNEIVGPLSLSHSREHVDFGVGFYTGDNYEQSLDFVSFTNEETIYVLDASYSSLKVLNLDISLEWMLLIAINRGKLERYKDSKNYQELVATLNSYDVIIAPIADNRMFTTIDDFTKSAITSEQAIHALKDLSLGKQIVFKTEESLKKIKILEKLYVSNKEKQVAKKKKLDKINEADSYILEAYSKYMREGQYISEVFLNEKDD